MIEDTAQIIRERMRRILHSQGMAGTSQARPEAVDSLHESPSASEQNICPGQDGFTPWILEEWRRFSIPQWRKILSEAESSGDSGRAAYAIWMLTEVLGVQPWYWPRMTSMVAPWQSAQMAPW